MRIPFCKPAPPFARALFISTALLLTTALVVWAQPAPRPERPNGAGLQLVERVLTADQRQSIRAIAEAQRDEVRTLTEKNRAARQALLRLSLAEKFDEEAVRAQASEVAKLETELMVLRARTLAQVDPPLSKEQIARILNPPSAPGADRERPRPNDRRGPDPQAERRTDRPLPGLRTPDAP